MGTEAHVRIDEGVKRGPRKPREPGTRLAKLKSIPGISYCPTKLTNVKPIDIITRYLNGESSEQIAHSLTVTRQGLAYFLRKNAEEDWREAQIIQAVERKELAEELLASCNDPLSLARAREQLRAAQWDLERLFSRLYGQRLSVESKQVMDPATQELANAAIELLARFREKVVNPEPIALDNKDIGQDEPT